MQKQNNKRGERMRKFISLQNVLALSLVFGSFYVIEAYNNTQKYASKETKKNNKNSKASMKAIEKELREIKQTLQKDQDVKTARKQLKTIPTKIKKAVDEMKALEEHGKMWKVYEHTLHKKLDRVKKFVASFEKNKNQKMHQNNNC